MCAAMRPRSRCASGGPLNHGLACFMRESPAAARPARRRRHRGGACRREVARARKRTQPRRRVKDQRHVAIGGYSAAHHAPAAAALQTRDGARIVAVALLLLEPPHPRCGGLRGVVSTPVSAAAHVEEAEHLDARDEWPAGRACRSGCPSGRAASANVQPSCAASSRCACSYICAPSPSRRWHASEARTVAAARLPGACARARQPRRRRRWRRPACPWAGTSSRRPPVHGPASRSHARGPLEDPEGGCDGHACRGAPSATSNATAASSATATRDGGAPAGSLPTRRQHLRRLVKVCA